MFKKLERAWCLPACVLIQCRSLQFESAKLSVWDNKWSEIYDFTPADRNWSFLPPDTKASDLIKPLGDLPGGSFVSKEESEEYSDDMVVPVTAGIRQSDFAGQERAFILLLPGKLAEGPTLLSKIPSSCVVIQTKQMQLEAAKVSHIPCCWRLVCVKPCSLLG